MCDRHRQIGLFVCLFLHGTACNFSMGRLLFSPENHDIMETGTYVVIKSVRH